MGESSAQLAPQAVFLRRAHLLRGSATFVSAVGICECLLVTLLAEHRQIGCRLSITRGVGTHSCDNCKQSSTERSFAPTVITCSSATVSLHAYAFCAQLFRRQGCLVLDRVSQYPAVTCSGASCPDIFLTLPFNTFSGTLPQLQTPTSLPHTY